MNRWPSPLHGLLALAYGFGYQQAADGEIFVQLGPVDPHSPTDKTPIAQGLGARIA